MENVVYFLFYRELYTFYLGGDPLHNIIDYIHKTGKFTFYEKPFQPVDSLILSQLSYLRMIHVVPSFDAKQPPVSLRKLALSQKPHLLYQETWNKKLNKELLTAAIRSERFGYTLLNYYMEDFDEQKEKQFAAVTFFLEDGTIYLAFRGTDTSIVGWKEDFNMAFLSPIPAQVAALSYLSKVAKQIKGSFQIGGHSKGGNLAVYAAIRCNKEIKRRISHIYSHDGPGFQKEILNSSDFLFIQHKIHKFLPQSSFVGMLLQHQESYMVVKSRGFWILQHDPFSWIIKNGDFQSVKTVKSTSIFVNDTLNNWINSMDDPTRERMIDILFQIIKTTKARNLYELKMEWKRNTRLVFHATKDLDPKTKIFILQTLRSLLQFIKLRNKR